MARPREFDMQTAVADAMAVFWTHGYEAASLPALLEGTGLSRGSLYKAFDGKKPLFIAALQHYETQEIRPMLATLQDPDVTDGIARIETVFMQVPKTVRGGLAKGCLLCSAAAGGAAHDPDIGDVIHGLLARMKGGFATALGASDKGSPDTAQMLLTQYVGLQTLARAGMAADALEDGVRALVAGLR